MATGDPRGAGYIHLPGYGNNWDEVLLYQASPADPSLPDTIDLDFFFNYDYEPGYGDMFTVEYDSAGTWLTVLQADKDDFDGPRGSNKTYLGVFEAPGVRFSDVAERAITYGGNDYGASGDLISIRLRFVSGGAWSDEDGLWPGDAGAVQVDDISIAHAGGSWFEDFEGPGPYLFTALPSPVAGPELSRVELSAHPNPFNPSTVVSFTARPGSIGSVEVFNLRGQLVRTLHRGEFRKQHFYWDGYDDSDALVGSGIYLIRATDGTVTRTSKVALVK